MNQHPDMLLRLAREHQAEMRRSAWDSRLRRDNRRAHRARRRPPS